FRSARATPSGEPSTPKFTAGPKLSRSRLSNHSTCGRTKWVLEARGGRLRMDYLLRKIFGNCQRFHLYRQSRELQAKCGRILAEYAATGTRYSVRRPVGSDREG